MERIEFATTSDGQITVRGESGTRLLKDDNETIDRVLELVERYYPAAFALLKVMYKESERNYRFNKYLRASRFIRCNMGVDDLLSSDIDDDNLHLEFVPCPLRGECVLEGFICRPKRKLMLSKAESEVAKMYAQGMSLKLIAKIRRVSINTVKNQLVFARKKFGLKAQKEIMRYIKTEDIYETM